MDMHQGLRWLQTGLGFLSEVGTLFAAVAFFVLAGKLKAASLHVVGAGLALIALSGIIVRTVWALRVLEWEHLNLMGSCNICMEVVAWIAIGVGALLATPKVLHRPGPGSG